MGHQPFTGTLTHEGGTGLPGENPIMTRKTCKLQPHGDSNPGPMSVRLVLMTAPSNPSPHPLTL